jgi:hypothetical protein
MCNMDFDRRLVLFATRVVLCVWAIVWKLCLPCMRLMVGDIYLFISYAKQTCVHADMKWLSKACQSINLLSMYQAPL